MTYRNVVEHALTVYYDGDRDLARNLVDKLLVEAGVAGEKDTRGESSPQQGESTHRHPRPCEYPTVTPCSCPRPGALPDASFARAKMRARIASAFLGGRAGRAVALQERAAR